MFKSSINTFVHIMYFSPSLKKKINEHFYTSKVWQHQCGRINVKIMKETCHICDNYVGVIHMGDSQLAIQQHCKRQWTWRRAPVPVI